MSPRKNTTGPCQYTPVYCADPYCNKLAVEIHNRRCCDTFLNSSLDHEHHPGCWQALKEAVLLKKALEDDRLLSRVGCEYGQKNKQAIALNGRHEHRDGDDDDDDDDDDGCDVLADGCEGSDPGNQQQQQQQREVGFPADEDETKMLPSYLLPTRQDLTHRDRRLLTARARKCAVPGYKMRRRATAGQRPLLRTQQQNKRQQQRRKSSQLPPPPLPPPPTEFSRIREAGASWAPEYEVPLLPKSGADDDSTLTFTTGTTTTTTTTSTTTTATTKTAARMTRTKMTRPLLLLYCEEHMSGGDQGRPKGEREMVVEFWGDLGDLMMMARGDRCRRQGKKKNSEGEGEGGDEGKKKKKKKNQVVVVVVDEDEESKEKGGRKEDADADALGRRWGKEMRSKRFRGYWREMREIRGLHLDSLF